MSLKNSCSFLERLGNASALFSCIASSNLYNWKYHVIMNCLGGLEKLYELWPDSVIVNRLMLTSHFPTC